MQVIKSQFKIIISIIAMLSIAIGFVMSEEYKSENVVVKITKNGFEPQSVTIQKGESITWVNTLDRPSWPASNSHPSHTEYKADKKGCINSSLDSCRGLFQNQSYIFTFDELGEWGIHDHLYPGFTMSVEVLPKIPFFANINKKSEQEKSPEIKGIPKEKDFKKLDYSEKRKVIKELNNIDPKLAWAYLKKAAIENGEVIVSVHEFAHTTGHQFYTKYGIDGIKLCSRDFAYGCFHGVTEQMLEEKGKDYLPEIEKKCLEFYPPVEGMPLDDSDCIHGVGHGLLSLNNLDLQQSLGDCDSLISEYRPLCWDGVFMELSVSAHKALDKNDPWKFCMDLNNQYQPRCAIYMADFLINSMPFNAREYAAICMKGQTERLRTLCMYRVGYQLVYLYKQEEKSIISECKSIDDFTAQTDCLMAAAREVTFQKYQKWQIVSRALCEQLPQELIEDCRHVE